MQRHPVPNGGGDRAPSAADRPPGAAERLTAIEAADRIIENKPKFLSRFCAYLGRFDTAYEYEEFSDGFVDTMREGAPGGRLDDVTLLPPPRAVFVELESRCELRLAREVEEERAKRRAARRERAERRAERERRAQERERRAQERATQPPAGGGITVPDVAGLDHQLAQDTMQAAGLYLLDEEDCTGQGRVLLWDRNWVVVSQDPPPGSVVSEDMTITLCANKDGE